YFHPTTVPFVSFFLFCLHVSPPPPRSALFPYTTLFRSKGPRSEGSGKAGASRRPPRAFLRFPMHGAAFVTRSKAALSEGVREERSEEHTSELQSRENLVCRLLLEKKNNDEDGRRGGMIA